MTIIALVSTLLKAVFVPGRASKLQEYWGIYIHGVALMKSCETIEEYNVRLKNTLLRIAKLHDVSNVKRDQIILLIAHASTVDLAAGHLARSRPSTVEDLSECFEKIPTGSVLILEKVQGRRGWTPNLYALPNMTYSGQSTMFDSGFVLREHIAATKMT